MISFSLFQGVIIVLRRPAVNYFYQLFKNSSKKETQSGTVSVLLCVFAFVGSRFSGAARHRP